MTLQGYFLEWRLTGFGKELSIYTYTQVDIILIYEYKSTVGICPSLFNYYILSAKINQWVLGGPLALVTVPTVAPPLCIFWHLWLANS